METFEFSVCLGCLQIRITAVDRYLSIEPGPIGEVLNRIIEAESDLRFDPDRDMLGGWVHVDADNR